MEFPKFTEEQLHNFDKVPVGVLVNVFSDNQGISYFYSNECMAQSLGYTHEELCSLLKENCLAAIYELDIEKTQNVRDSVMEGKVVDSISRQKRKDGSIMWILAHVRRIDIEGRTALLFFFSRIQDLIGLQNDLQSRNEEWDDILKSIPIGLMVFRVDNGITTTISVNGFLIDFANAVGALLDSKHREWSEAEMSLIFNQDVFAFCENEDIPKAQKMLEDSEKQPISYCIFKLRGSSVATPVYIYATCASKKIEDGSRIYYVSYQNITTYENHRLNLFEKQNQLIHLSYYDALTGVKNRNAYNATIEKCRSDKLYNMGLAFCDVNGLKATNDTLGHIYGDRLICSFASILKELFDIDEIYRISGDEFVVIKANITQDEFQKMMDRLYAKIVAEGRIASIGHIWKAEVSDIQRRAMQAEQIMYVEKQRFYEMTSKMNSKHRPMFLEKLLADFEEGRFVMYLQPKTSIDNSRVFGAEALVRKYDAEGNIVMPYEFVPQLEHEKLIPKLDFYMLEQACKFLEKIHLQGRDDFSVSVNISRVTIVENDFIANVQDVIGRYDFVRSNLELELTESNKTMDASRLEACLIQLKLLGVKLSLDDMGCDYSTIMMLTMEGFDWIKMDRTIVLKMAQEKTKILIKHIIEMSHDMKLKVIAEGVEKDDERQELMDMGCDAYQGYLQSKPVSVGEFEERFLGD